MLNPISMHWFLSKNLLNVTGAVGIAAATGGSAEPGPGAQFHRPAGWRVAGLAGAATRPEPGQQHAAPHSLRCLRGSQPTAGAWPELEPARVRTQWLAAAAAQSPIAGPQLQLHQPNQRILFHRTAPVGESASVVAAHAASHRRRRFRLAQQLAADAHRVRQQRVDVAGPAHHLRPETVALRRPERQRVVDGSAAWMASPSRVSRPERQPATM